MRDRKKGFMISGAVILLGILFWLLKIYAIGRGLILAGVILFVLTLCHSRKPEIETIQDERIKRIDDKAGHYAFWITIFVLTTIYWINVYEIKIGLKDMYSWVLFTGLFSWILLRFYFSKKGLE